jgi:hypothetical protein
MKMNLIKSLALTLGVSAVIPTIAKAHDRDQCDVPVRITRDSERYQTDRYSDRYAPREDVRYSREEVRYPREEVRREEFRRQDYRRDEIRVERARRVELCDVPPCVLDRVNDYRHGRRIQCAEVVCQDGRDVYQFRIDDDRAGDFRLDIAGNGHLIGRY